MAGPVLEMRSIVKTFPGVKALSDVTLTVAAGRGPRHLRGERRRQVHPDEGAQRRPPARQLRGRDPLRGGALPLQGHPGQRAARHRDHPPGAGAGAVPVHRGEHLPRQRTRHARASSAGTRRCKHAAALLRRVGLDEHPQTRVADIGVGKQQLVEIAKALSKKVKLLILDEPTAALNDEDSGKLLRSHPGVEGPGHHLDHHLAQAERDRAGRRLRDDPAGRPDHRDPRREGRRRPPRTGSSAAWSAATSTTASRSAPRTRPRRAPHPALEIRDWTVHHPIDQQRKVVDDVSLHVRRGEIVGIAGLMGAGRTELAMSVFGRSLRPATSAARSSRTARRSVPGPSPRRSAHGIAYVTEDRKHYGLNLIDTISRNISLSALGKVARRGVVDEHEERRVAEWLPQDHEHQGADRLRAGRQAVAAATSRRSSSASGSSRVPTC